MHASSCQSFGNALVNRYQARLSESIYRSDRLNALSGIGRRPWARLFGVGNHREPHFAGKLHSTSRAASNPSDIHRPRLSAQER
jgi:hypothetical protein